MIEKFCRTVMLAIVVIGAVMSLTAAPVIPKESGKALGVTKPKTSVDTGLVFINGKYLEPPYKVERWGTGIRINGKTVIGEVVTWTDFLKTQSGVKVTKTETPVEATPAPSPAPAPAPEPTVEEDEDADSALDDLFEDDPKPKKAKKPAAPKPAAPKAPPKPKKPTVTVNYSMDGDFVPNDASKMLVKRINAVRQEIDARLRSGGFICFGDNYARVTGDQRTAMLMLEKLPELQRSYETAREFQSAVRNAGMVYLTDALCEDLFKNRVDYRSLQERRAKWKKELEMKKMLDGLSSPLF